MSHSWISSAWIQDPRKEYYFYDPANGQLTKVMTGYPKANQYVYLNRFLEAFDTVGRPTRLTDERGVVTTVAYDTLGRPTSQTRTGEAALSLAYPTALSREQTRSGLTTREERDGFGRVFRVTAPDGGRQEQAFDALGRPATRRLVSNQGTVQPAAAFDYDLLDRPTETLNPGGKGATQKLAYALSPVNTARLRITQTLDPSGVNAQSLSDQNLLGQTVWSQDPLGSTTTATYDALGNLAQADLRDASGRLQTRKFLYDALGRLTQRDEPETGLTTFGGFDALGNPTTLTEAAGTTDARTRTLAFDGLGRLVQQVGGTTSLTYTYTGADLTSATNTSGGLTVTQTYGYDPITKRLITETTTQPDHTATLSYDYDPTTGQLKTLTYPGGRVVRYGTDGLGRVNAIWQKPGATAAEVPVVTNISFNQWGQQERLTFASGAYSNWSTKDFGTHLDQWTIGFTAGGLTDPANPRVYMVDTAERLSQAGEWNLKPDLEGRIAEAKAPALNGTLTPEMSVTSTFSHDGFDNLTEHSRKVNDVPSFDTFKLDPLVKNLMPTATAATDSPANRATGWAYRKTGEALSFGVTAGSSQKVNLTWDGLGRLASASPTGYTQSYAYAPSGLRVRLTDSGAAANNRRYAYTSGGLLLSEFTANPTPAWKRDVLYLGGEAIAEIDSAGTHELHNDHLGSPRIVTNAATGRIEGRQAFGAYGEKLLQEGYPTLTGYTGHLQQDATGLIYMRGRYYSTAWKRFLNSDQGVDPNSWNQMAYVGGRPFEASDPTGMKVATCFVIITTWYSNGRIIGQYYTVVYCSGGGGGGGGGGRGGGKDREQAKPQTPTKTDCERFVDGLVADGQKARNQVAGAWRLGLEYANKTFNAKVPIGKIGGFKDEFTRYGQGIEAYLHMYGVASGYLMGPGPGGLVSLYRSAADGLQLFDNESNGKGATRSLEAESELFGNKAGLDIGTALFNFINNDAASQTDLFKYLKGKLCK